MFSFEARGMICPKIENVIHTIEAFLFHFISSRSFYNHHFVLINLCSLHLKKWSFCLQIGFVREDGKAKNYGNEGVSKCTSLLKTMKIMEFPDVYIPCICFMPPPPDNNINFCFDANWQWWWNLKSGVLLHDKYSVCDVHLLAHYVQPFYK